jgi:hypothetical protein
LTLLTLHSSFSKLSLTDEESSNGGPEEDDFFAQALEGPAAKPKPKAAATPTPAAQPKRTLLTDPTTPPPSSPSLSSSDSDTPSSPSPAAAKAVIPKSTSTPKLIRPVASAKKKGGLGGVKKPIQAKKVSHSAFDDFDAVEDTVEEAVNTAIASNSNSNSNSNSHSERIREEYVIEHPSCFSCLSFRLSLFVLLTLFFVNSVHSHSAFSSRLTYSEDEPSKPDPSPSNQSRYVSSLGSGSGASSGRGSSSVSSSSASSSNRAAVDPTNKYANAKSISSAQYFGEDQPKHDPEKERRLMKFSGSSSISSADYYERDENDMSAGDLARKLAYATTTDLSQIQSIVYTGSQKLSSMANDFLNDLQNRYQ